MPQVVSAQLAEPKRSLFPEERRILVRRSPPHVDPAGVPNPSDPAPDSVLVDPREHVDGMLATHLLEDGLGPVVQYNNTRLPVLALHCGQDEYRTLDAR